MKVAIVTNGAKPVPDVEGGAVEHLVTTLIDKNEVLGCFEFDVFTLESNKIRTNYNCSNIIQVKNKQKNILIRVFFSLLNRLCLALQMKRHYDYISLAIAEKVNKNYDYVLVENSIFICKLIQKKYRGKVLFHLHNDFDTIDYDFDKTKSNIRDVCKLASKVITASDYLKRHIIEKTNANNVYCLNNCVDKSKFNPEARLTSEFRKKMKIKKEDFVVLFCGRLSEEKGALELIRAFSRLKHIENIKLVIVGDNYFGSKKEDEYRNKINDALTAIQNNVILCGAVSYGQMPEIYGGADVVVIPTQCVEAFGMTALEAISVGVPCIASYCGGLIDILDESCARFIRLGNNYINELGKTIEEFYNMSDVEFESMKKNAIVKSQQFYNEDEYYEAFCEILQKCYK